MNIVIDKLQSDILEFTVLGVTASFANAICRTLMNDVETIAVHTVSFETNNTVFTEEFIAHRLAMMPLSGIEFIGPEDINTIQLSFDKTSKKKRPEVWYTDDIVINDDRVSVAVKGIPLVKVVKGQQLKFTATIKAGTGFEHSKWSPVTKCFTQKTGLLYKFIIHGDGSMNLVEAVKKALDTLEDKFRLLA